MLQRPKDLQRHFTQELSQAMCLFFISTETSIFLVFLSEKECHILQRIQYRWFIHLVGSINLLSKKKKTLKHFYNQLNVSSIYFSNLANMKNDFYHVDILDHPIMKILYLFWFHHNSPICLSQRLKNAVMKPNQNISEKKYSDPLLVLSISYIDIGNYMT